MDLSARDNEILDKHIKVSKMKDRVRVLQWEGTSSVYYAEKQRIWLHNHHPRLQSFQEYYFHSVDAESEEASRRRPVVVASSPFAPFRIE